MKEPTKWIKDFEGIYSITRDGRVWSYPKFKGFYTTKGHYLRPFLMKSGYSILHLKKNGKDCNRFLHRAVAEAWISNPKKLPCVNHKDCNRNNNSASNLEWVTHKENSEYMVKMGNSLQGEKHFNSKLKKEQVVEIRSLYKRKRGNRLILSAKYNVSIATIKNVISRKTWKWLE